MGIAPKYVTIAYRFSTDPRTARFSHLSKHTHLIELFARAENTAKSTRSKKEFFVEVKELDAEADEKQKAKSSKKGKEKQLKSKKRVSVCCH